MKLTKKLSKYGVVVTNKTIKDQVATVLITEGFSEKDTLNVMKDVQEHYSDYSVLETMVTDDNLCLIILTTPNK